MSRWTHVNGNVRIDSIPHLDGDIKQKIKEYLGKPSDEEWDGCKLPMGSEGSIGYTIHGAPRHVSFNGDLRDYPAESDYHPERTIEAIIKWFEDFVSHFWVRQGVLQISVEGGEEFLLHTYQDKDYKTHVHKTVFTKRQQLLSSKKDPICDKERTI